jgi:1-acyl-sn-glycerol-3-phosphate acyltransferase
VFFIPSFVSYKSCYYFSKIWAMGLAWGLKLIIGVKIEVEGLENIPKDTGCVIASKHQSAFETFYYFFLPNAAFVYKKELQYIPFFGFYHMVLRNIAVDRKAGATALKKVLKQTKERVGQGRQVIIFPEGTRAKPKEYIEYKPAIYAIYKNDDIQIIPASLNSGLFWQKNSFIKKQGTIKIKFFSEIQKGLNKEDFYTKLRENLDCY